jgi:hypothetical protein
VAVVHNYGALFQSFFALNLWLDSFNTVMELAPYVLVAPLLFATDPKVRRLRLHADAPLRPR